MTHPSQVNYRLLDQPEVLMFLFHPRPGYEGLKPWDSAIDVLIPVADEVKIGGRFHRAGSSAPNILFFHGNGEIVDDYLDMGKMYNDRGINFLAVDYRGYGRSSGRPTSSGMIRDSHKIFRFAKNWLAQHRYTGPFIAMGRSLGSASALELAVSYKDEIDGLIIESGFAYTGPLFRLIGVDMEALGFKESEGFNHLEKIRKFDKPTLIIHAENDHIIPFSDGQTLYEASPASHKRLVKIPHANHNNIFLLGISEYMRTIKTFSEKLTIG